jgi:regulator of cell morphogenesis and NO signaling
MTTLDLTQTVADFMEANPECFPIFGELHSEYEFSRNLTMGEFCKLRQLEPREIVAAMQDDDQWAHFWDKRFLREFNVPQIIGYILLVHHAPLKKDLPKIVSLIDAVLRSETPPDAELPKLAETFKRFKKMMEWHMQEEEKLFSFFLLLDVPGKFMALDWFEIQELSQENKVEDEQVQGYLEEFRKLTNDFSTPENGSGNYIDLMRSLGRVEYQLRRHVGIETQILFPKVMDLIREQLSPDFTNDTRSSKRG